MKPKQAKKLVKLLAKAVGKEVARHMDAMTLDITLNRAAGDYAGKWSGASGDNPVEDLTFEYGSPFNAPHDDDLEHTPDESGRGMYWVPRAADRAQHHDVRTVTSDGDPHPSFAQEIVDGAERERTKVDSGKLLENCGKRIVRMVSDDGTQWAWDDKRGWYECVSAAPHQEIDADSATYVIAQKIKSDFGLTEDELPFTGEFIIDRARSRDGGYLHISFTKPDAATMRERRIAQREADESEAMDAADAIADGKPNACIGKWLAGMVKTATRIEFVDGTAMTLGDDGWQKQEHCAKHERGVREGSWEDEMKDAQVDAVYDAIQRAEDEKRKKQGTLLYNQNRACERHAKVATINDSRGNLHAMLTGEVLKEFAPLVAGDRQMALHDFQYKCSGFIVKRSEDGELSLRIPLHESKRVRPEDRAI